MARRSDHSREELTDLAVSAASKIIAEEGVQALTIRKVASDIGYAPGSIYNVVENIDDLIGRVNARTMGMLNDRLTKINWTEDATTNVRLLLATFLDFEAANPRLWAANTEYDPNPDFVNTEAYLSEVETSLQIGEAAISPLFTRHPEGAARLAIHVLWASLQGILTLSHSGKLLTGDNESAKTLAENLIETYIKGVKAFHS